MLFATEQELIHTVPLVL